MEQLSVIRSRLSSWQAHLERICKYLVKGQGVWWDKTVLFLDGESNPDYHTEGPQLKHYRSSSLQEVIADTKKAWKTIFDHKVSLPITSLRLYDENGYLLSIREMKMSAEGNSDILCNTTDENHLEIMECSVIEDDCPVTDKMHLKKTNPYYYIYPYFQKK